MASGNFKGTWVVLVLVVIAVVLAIFMLKPASLPQPSPSAQGISVEKNRPTVHVQVLPQSESSPVSIKPDHSVQDMQEIATRKRVSAVVVPPQEVVPAPRFAVQLHSFKEKTFAEDVARSLKERNYSAYIMVSDLGPRGIWYRVRVGTYPNEDAAQKALEKIAKEFKSGIIVAE